MHEKTFEGWPVFTVTPPGPPTGHVLYLHGGGHVTELTALHWEFITRLAESTGRSVTVPVFPIAPAATHRDVFPTLGRLYDVVAAAHAGERLAVAGDSSGGGLALALVQALPAETPRPSDLVLLSPWLDATMTDPALAALEPLDPMLTRDTLRRFGRAFAGADNPAVPWVSPLNGPLDRLGRVTVFAGTHDILLADARRLHAVAANVDLREYAGMTHAWMLAPTPQAAQLIDELATLLA